jgi:hypothetical protein
VANPTTKPKARPRAAAAHFAGSAAGQGRRTAGLKVPRLLIDTLPALAPGTRARIEALAARVCDADDFFSNEMPDCDMALFAEDQRALADLLAMLFEPARPESRAVAQYCPVIALDYWYHRTHLKQPGVSKAMQKRWGITGSAVKKWVRQYQHHMRARYQWMRVGLKPLQTSERIETHIADEAAYWAPRMARARHDKRQGTKHT